MSFSLLASSGAKKHVSCCWPFGLAACLVAAVASMMFSRSCGKLQYVTTENVRGMNEPVGAVVLSVARGCAPCPNSVQRNLAAGLTPA